MHPVTALILATSFHEKSKTAFYVLGGLLVAWALIVSITGFSRPEFVRTERAVRTLIGFSIALVVAAAAAAVLTASVPEPVKAYTRPVPQKGTAPAPTQAGAPAPAPAAQAAPPGPAASAPRASTGASVLALAADPGGQLRYGQPSLSANAGRVTIDFTNGSPVPHNVAVASSGRVLGATPTFSGGSRKLTLTLKAGSYTFFCQVPGHQQAGMQGTLTVA